MPKPPANPIGPPEEKYKRLVRLRRRALKRFKAKFGTSWAGYMAQKKRESYVALNGIEDENGNNPKRETAIRAIAKIKGISLAVAIKEARGEKTAALTKWVRDKRRLAKEVIHVNPEVTMNVRFKKVDMRSDAATRRILTEQEERMKELEAYRSKPVWKPRMKA